MNEDPDIYRYAYGSESFPPKGANRGHYVNARLDALLKAAMVATDQVEKRRDYVEVQQILAEDIAGDSTVGFPNNLRWCTLPLRITKM